MSNLPLTNRILQTHLASWRYLALLTLPPLGIAFHFLSSSYSVLLLILFFTTHYFCWRLWLDERLFRLLKSESELADFDEGMSYVWPEKQAGTRTLAERGLGVRRLFHWALCSTSILWLTALCFVAWPY